MYPNTLLYINGQWCAAASGRTLPVVNPANHQQIGTVAYAEKADLDRALFAVVAADADHTTTTAPLLSEHAA